jgi:2-polyprenyl-6-methoxyphenol hydroxylase-like FAD-dependent oxidoreductase
MRILTMGVMLLALAACDPQRVEKLEEGVATEAQVRQQFGEPVTIIRHADGSQVFDYPRQPEGWTNYRIVIGADGRMSSLRQLLNDDNFAHVKPGMDQSQVRELLGRPASMKRYDLKQEEVWNWRFKPMNESRQFSVSFGPDARVLSSMTGDDPREASPSH